MRTIRIDPHARETVFRGWGTSLAWWADAVGRWPRARRNAVVRQVFGRSDGGLGLTVARFNAGGGENPGIVCTMTSRAAMEGYRPGRDAPIDKSADPGQRAVLREAAAAVRTDGGDLLVELFGNSPPWWATISGSVTGNSNEDGWPLPNLDRVFERDYLRYLHDVADFVERDARVHVASLSPFNEPTARWWVLGGRQEGCHFSPEGIDHLLTTLSKMPEATEGRTIAASEEWSLEQAVATYDALGPSARRTVGRLNVHTYDGQWRSAVQARAARAGIGLWVSEFGEGEATGFDLAAAIVRDLRELSPNAWVLWQAVSPDHWGALRLLPDGSAVEATPKFEVFARFTRSIRPGMRLVGTDDPHSVAAVGAGIVSAVVLGSLDAEETVRIDLGNHAVGFVEVATTDTLDRGRTVAQQLPCEDGAVTLRLPAGGVASMTAAVTEGDDDGRFRGSGTWWLEHESGARLGLDAAGARELDAGVRVRGVAPDDTTLAQRWHAQACGDGSTRWVCAASGHQLDVVHASQETGAHVVEWWAGLAEHAPAHNRFDVVDAGDGGVMLVARHSAQAIALDDRGLGVQRSPGEPGTRWRLYRAGE
jgi:O-glycosyl hydrolase